MKGTYCCTLNVTIEHFEFMAVAAQILYGIVHGDAQRNAEDNDGRGLDGDACETHDCSGSQQWNNIGNHGHHNHPGRRKKQSHQQGYHDNGNRNAFEQMLDKEFSSPGIHHAIACDLHIIIFWIENRIYPGTNFGYQPVHLFGTDICHLETDACILFGAVNEGA